MRRFPRTLKIGAHKYKVRLLPPSECKRRLPGRAAQVDPDQNEILIQRRFPPTRRVELALHEVIHAMLAKHRLSCSQEEKIVTVLGEEFTHFLLANKDLIRYLWENGE